jgi:ankyrin repeat protein
MPLHFAAQNGHLDIVNVLVGKRLDVNAVNSDQVKTGLERS